MRLLWHMVCNRVKLEYGGVGGGGGGEDDTCLAMGGWGGGWGGEGVQGSE